MNFARAQHYLDYLTKAGWFTPQFMRDQAQQFRRRDVDFRRTRQAYGPPTGFGFGWILYTPQPEKVVAAALATGRITATETDAGQWQARVQLPDNGRLVLDLVAAADSARIETIYPDGIEQLAGQ
ncbi:hypothetical protein [Hymenobacter edaphi]|uniref:Uncharacterized protein n=1 Tax=Hymenobacter edaphi TaxID=2211146 RepID=A0A328B9F0_9BACT|nr:hypothetical protein [Hymenobacter edaphi]RAK63449.1 hypothetical protein DLM85_20810 [Hymenobacter edaphi]